MFDYHRPTDLRQFIWPITCSLLFHLLLVAGLAAEWENQPDVVWASLQTAAPVQDNAPATELAQENEADSPPADAAETSTSEDSDAEPSDVETAPDAPDASDSADEPDPPDADDTFQYTEPVVARHSNVKTKTVSAPEAAAAKPAQAKPAPVAKPVQAKAAPVAKAPSPPVAAPPAPFFQAASVRPLGYSTASLPATPKLQVAAAAPIAQPVAPPIPQPAAAPVKPATPERAVPKPAVVAAPTPVLPAIKPAPPAPAPLVAKPKPVTPAPAPAPPVVAKAKPVLPTPPPAPAPTAVPARPAVPAPAPVAVLPKPAAPAPAPIVAQPKPAVPAQAPVVAKAKPVIPAPVVAKPKPVLPAAAAAPIVARPKPMVPAAPPLLAQAKPVPQAPPVARRALEQAKAAPKEQQETLTAPARALPAPVRRAPPPVNAVPALVRSAEKAAPQNREIPAPPAAHQPTPKLAATLPPRPTPAATEPRSLTPATAATLRAPAPVAAVRPPAAAPRVQLADNSPDRIGAAGKTVAKPVPVSALPKLAPPALPGKGSAPDGTAKSGVALPLTGQQLAAVRPAAALAPAKPSAHPEKKGAVTPPQTPDPVFEVAGKGDLEIELSGKEVAANGIKVRVLFRSFPKARHKKAMTLAESRKSTTLLPRASRTAVSTVQSVLENASDGVYEFRSVLGAAQSQEVSITLTINGKSSSRVVKRLGVKKVGGDSYILKVLMPEGVLWDDEASFSGSIEDSDGVTKYNADSGLVWKEYN